MLYALSIQSFVLIDRLDLEAANGFTALTGETGAGKSIILDALGLVMGGPADRKQVRVGAEQANITAEFALPPEHPVWDILQQHSIDHRSDEMLVLRRTVSRSGPSRAFVNAQSVAASVLSELAEVLVEIHGQHAASALMRPSTHLELLDTYGGLEAQAEICRDAWSAFETARTARQQLEADVQSAKERQEWLTFAVEELSSMSPEQGELEALTTRRGALLQSERITDAVSESTKALADPKLEDALMRAAKAVDRIVRIPGLETLDDKLPDVAGGASDALERTLIELAEAQSCVSTLSQYAAHDATQLAAVEERLFALRALARKYDSQPELLADTLQRFQAELALCDSDAEAFENAARVEAETQATWRLAAEALSDGRKQKATELEHDIQTQLAPLHLERVRVRVAFSPIGEDDSGARGLERAAFEVQTNPGASFGPLKAIASGGELARFSLALKCALSESGRACTLIFDEADQGVGGAVAAAIGERLAELAKDRQVFAVTHSPQVASAASRQWRVMKEMNAEDQVFTHVAQLDDGQRLEEIARMLSGSSITNEARAAALKLLEAA
ncbi:MAG: DNA repair protein RecN [Henriciella sp.]|nr:DNA repair protein RecN [Henriciella sp.]